MMIYTAMLGASGAVGPLSALLFSGSSAWRWSLGVWVVPVVIQVIVWVIVLGRTKKDVPSAGVMPDPEALAEEFENAENRPARTLLAQHVSDPGGSLVKSPTAIAMMLFFGIQSSGAYAQMGWLSAIRSEE